jgi:hypothetical protein
MEQQQQQQQQDHILGGGISSEALLRLFEILPVECCTQIWTSISDDDGSHARALLQQQRGKQRPLRAELAPIVWSRLQRYLEHIMKTENGRRELLDMHINDHFVDQCWPYLCQAMGNELDPRDPRLLVRYTSDATRFTELRVTSMALEHASMFVHPKLTQLNVRRFDRDAADKLKELVFLCGPSLAIIHVEEGIVPELLDIIHQALPPHQRQQLCYRCPSVSFGEMLWMARWWQETRDIRLVVEAVDGERWAPRRASAWYNLGSTPLRAKKQFSYTDAAWIIAEAERRKAARRNASMLCPACGQHDPTARHLWIGDGYTCTRRTGAAAAAVNNNRTGIKKPTVRRAGGGRGGRGGRKIAVTTE